jgi:Rrf2 family nitric oxide-sensitive transcriptional repressor
MRLTKTTGHAIRILIDCAESDGERVKVAGVADRLGISQLNAFKIVHILSKAGFLEAMRGRNGGVKLARGPEEIRIGAIVREIEATEMIVEGAEPKGKSTGRSKASAAKSSGPKSPINVIFEDALGAFIDVLDRHTLADLSTPRKSAKPVKKAEPIVVKKSASKPAGAGANGKVKPTKAKAAKPAAPPKSGKSVVSKLARASKVPARRKVGGRTSR